MNEDKEIFSNRGTQQNIVPVTMQSNRFTHHQENEMKNHIIRFLKDEEGATAIEYALIAGVIAVGILVSLGDVRQAIIGLFNQITTALGGAPTT